MRAGRGTTVGRALLEGRSVQIVDVLADPEYAFDEDEENVRLSDSARCPDAPRRNSDGRIALTRTEVERFTDKQIALVETFADQAVIAIENVRLFEAEQRVPPAYRIPGAADGDLGGAENHQQFARRTGAGVPRHAGERDAHLRGELRQLLLYEGDVFRHVALHNAPPAWADERERDPIPPRHAARVLYRVADTKRSLALPI